MDDRKLLAWWHRVLRSLVKSEKERLLLHQKCGGGRRVIRKRLGSD